TCTPPRPRPPPRCPAWAGGAGGAGLAGGGWPRCWPIASVEHNAISANADEKTRIGWVRMALLERRGLRLAPGVVAQAQRLHRIQILAVANHVGPVIRRRLR